MTLNTHANDPPRTLRQLGRLALDAAAELDARVSNPHIESTKVRNLANELKKVFPGDGRPLLPSETIGLVCDVIEYWENGSTTYSYVEASRIAREIADMLERPTTSEKEADRLIDFCLSLHDVTRNMPAMHDFPEDHPYILTLA